jgi:hypothetical protein
MSEKLDAEELSRSLTGFDEIAIQKWFKAPFTDLSSTLVSRALIFIHRKRQGASDADAYRTVMEMGLGEVAEHFDDGTSAEGNGRAKLATAPTRAS